MKLNTTNKQVIRETGYGCWVWELPTGEILGQDEQFMLVFGTENDVAAKKAITDAARHYGYPDGTATFWPDVRPVSDEEYESQLERAEQGLTPDPFDIAAINEEMRALKNGR